MVEYLVGEAPANLPRVPGVVQLPADAGGQWVAVNVDPREANPGRLSAEQFQATITRLADTGTTAARVGAERQHEQQRLWRYVLALMLGVLVLESFVAAKAA